VELGGVKELDAASLLKAAHWNMGVAAYRKFGSPIFFVPTYFPDFLSRLVNLDGSLKHSPRAIGGEAGYLTGSTQQSRRDGVKVAQDASPGWD